MSSLQHLLIMPVSSREHIVLLVNMISKALDENEIGQDVRSVYFKRVNSQALFQLIIQNIEEGKYSAAGSVIGNNLNSGLSFKPMNMLQSTNFNAENFDVRFDLVMETLREAVYLHQLLLKIRRELESMTDSPLLLAKSSVEGQETNSVHNSNMRRVK